MKPFTKAHAIKQALYNRASAQSEPSIIRNPEGTTSFKSSSYNKLKSFEARFPLEIWCISILLALGKNNN